jgi:hypothetical protein
MSTGSRRRAVFFAAIAAGLLWVAAACSDDGPADADGPPTDDPVATTSTTAPTSAVAVEVRAPISESRPVGPPADSPLAAVRRDCGSSEALPGGGRIWLYCDTTMFHPDDGRLQWFVNTSAAVATDDEPLVMLESLDRDGRVHPLLEPGLDYPRCGDGEGRFTWPTAAVPADDDGREVLAVFYENVCVVPLDFNGYDSGIAVLDLPADPPEALAEQPIEAEIVEDRLFTRDERTAPFGQAAVRVDDQVYAYRCPRRDAACEVARAPARLEDLADITMWEVWDGTGWVPHGDDGAAAEPMVMPDPARGLKPSVAWLEELGVYAMVDNPAWAPSRVHLRVAEQPWGPWSARVIVQLPGCEGDWPDVCFAIEIHEHLSDEGTIGLTWFDAALEVGTVPMRFAAVEVTVVRTGE